MGFNDKAQKRVWSLVADVGGTNARFAAVDMANGEICEITYFSVAEHQVFADVIDLFLAQTASSGQWAERPQEACLAVASPVGSADEKQRYQFTNSAWQVDTAGLSHQLGDIPFFVINDFAAIGYALSALESTDCHQLGGHLPLADRPAAVLGPGTGLGVCTVLPTQPSPTVLAGEGGHADFAPVDAEEIAVLNCLMERFGRVSYERLLSGPGMLAIYQALAQLAGRSPEYERPEDIYDAAIEGVDTLAMRTVQLFCRVLGSFAGNTALTVGARGGVYIAGGIPTKILPILEESDFRHRFDSKGRMRSYLTDIPVYIITASDIGLRGAAQFLGTREQAQQTRTTHAGK
jgi:glucokinase